MRHAEYMNFAADLRPTPIDRATEQALREARRRQRVFADAPRSTWSFFRRKIEGSREAVAAAIGACSPERVVFTDGTISGLRVTLAGAVRARLLQAGDRVLVTDAEYGGTYRELEGLFDLDIVRTIGCPEDEVVDRLARACAQSRPRLVVASQVCFLDGRVLPVARAIRETRHRLGLGAPLWAIDGAQALGNIPVDVEALGADFYFGGFHKWVQGPASTGFLHVSDDRALHGVALRVAHLFALHPRLVEELGSDRANECSRVGLLLPETAVLGGHLRRHPSVARGAGGQVATALRNALEAESELAPHLVEVRPEARSSVVSLQLPVDVGARTSGIDEALRARKGDGVPVVATLHVPRLPASMAASGVAQPAVLRLSCVDGWNDPCVIPGVVARLRYAWSRWARTASPRELSYAA